MATIIQDKDLDKTKSGGTLGQPTPPTTPQAPPTVQPNTVQANQPTKPKQTGSGFTNLNRVVQANQGNKLGQAVAGGVQQNVQNVRSGVQQAQTQFQQKAGENELGTEEQKNRRDALLGKAMNAPSELSDADIQANQRFLSGRYTGPQGLENADILTGKAREAETLGSMAGTTAGRGALLTRFAGGQGYTAGQNRLDNTLLGATAGADLSRARRESMGTGQQVLQAAQGAEGQAKQLGQQAQAFGTETGQKLNEATGGIQDTVNEQLTAAQEAESKRAGSGAKIQEILRNAYNTNDPAKAAAFLEEAANSGLVNPEQIKKMKQELTFANAIKDTTAHGGMINDALGATWRTLQYLKNKSDKTPGEWGRLHALEAQQGSLDSIKSQALSGSRTSSTILKNMLDRLNDQGAQNLTTQGLTNEQQRAQLNALSRLSGQSNVFSAEDPRFQAGSLAYDADKGAFDAESGINNLGEFGNRYLDMGFYGNRRIT
jgi:hypothetical protein